MKSIKDNAIYIENVTVQGADENDWSTVKNTNVQYLPKELDVTDLGSGIYECKSTDREPVVGESLIAIVDSVIDLTNIEKIYTEEFRFLDTPVEVNQLTASDAEDSDNFGNSVAISGDGLIAMVGAHGEDSAGTNAGKVYTYKRATIDDTWTEVNQLTASDAEDYDYFGYSVALSSDGLIAMVGASDEDSAGSGAGKVYTYKRDTIDDTWTEVSQLTASDAEDSDDFGWSVALSGDGLIAMVGAPYEDSAGTNTGKVYTYKRDTIDDAWTEVNQLTASDAEDSDYFGSSVALSGDGLIAIVGAHTEDTAGADAGKVYTYKRDTIDDAWTEVSQLTASDAEDSDNFGISVAISGDGLIAMVGAHGEDSAGSDAGKVYTYKRDTIDDTWTEVLQLTASDAEDSDYFGSGVALSNDGLIAMVGAHTEDTAGSDAGKVYTYNIAEIIETLGSVKVYDEVNQLTASDAEDYDYFGTSVALSGDGLIAMVGANGEDSAGTDAGKVYAYKRDTIDDTWTEVNQLTASDATDSDGFGSGVALSSDGLITMVGTRYKDKVYTYKRDTIDDTWTEVSQLTASDAEDSDDFGWSVALSGDGLIAMVGAPYEDSAGTSAGKVYTYKRDTIDDIWTEVSQLTASDAEDDDQFGAGVALSSDGLIAVVGARYEDAAANDAGKVYTYKRDTIDDAWTEVSQLTASDAEDSDDFGWSVALSGDGLIAMVGAPYEDSAGTDTGKVYTYKRDTIDDIWTEVSQLTASDAEDSDYYGSGVAISGDGHIAMVGAYLEDTAGNGTGKVYTYKLVDKFNMTLTTTLANTPTNIFYNDNLDVSVTLEYSENEMLTLPEELIILDESTASDGSNIVSQQVLVPGIIIVNDVEALSGDITYDDTTNLYTMLLPSHGLTTKPLEAYYKGKTTLVKQSATTTEFVGYTKVESGIVAGDTVLLDNNEVTIDDVTSEVITIVDLENIVEVNQLTASDAEDYDYFGSGVALSSDGLIAMVSAGYEETAGTDAGKVYTYKRDTIDDTWTEVSQLTASDAEDDDFFGSSVALSSDGLIAMVGAGYEDSAGTNTGKVYTYKRDTIDDAWTEVNQLIASDAEDDDQFGRSVVLSSDGLIAMVGANGEDTATTDAGKVYTYKRDTIDDTWTEVSQLTASDAEDSDQFGFSVALSGDGLIAIVGARSEDSTGTDAGKVYTYKRDTIDDTWTEVSQLTASDAEDSDDFGWSVALSGDGLIAMVGAPYEDSAGTSAGKVYTYKLGTTNINYTLTFTEQSVEPTTASVIDKSIRLSEASKSYDGTMFTRTFNDLSKTGRAIQRKIRASKKDTLVIEPLTSDLDKLS